MAKKEIGRAQGEFAKDNFGPGRAGESAYTILQTVEICEFIEEPCGLPPVFTLDFDVFGQLEQIALCENHIEAAKNRIREDLSAIGRHAVSFGLNGRGRA